MKMPDESRYFLPWTVGYLNATIDRNIPKHRSWDRNGQAKTILDLPAGWHVRLQVWPTKPQPVSRSGQAGPPWVVAFKCRPGQATWLWTGPAGVSLAAGQPICWIVHCSWAADLRILAVRPACRIHLPTHKFNRTSIIILCFNDTHCCCR